MKYLRVLAPLGLLMLAGCNWYSTNVSNVKVKRIDKEIIMSGGAFSGDVSGTFSVFSGNMAGHTEGYSSSDMIKVPYNIDVDIVRTFNNDNGNRDRTTEHRSYQVDLYFQRSEMINMARNNPLPFTVVTTSSFDYGNSRNGYQRCLYIKYGYRTVDITNPGNTNLDCFWDHNDVKFKNDHYDAK